MKKPQYKIGEIVFGRCIGSLSEKEVKEIYVNKDNVVYVLGSIGFKTGNYDGVWEESAVYKKYINKPK